MTLVLTVGESGQVMLGEDLLRHLGVQPGEQIKVDMLPNGRIEVRAARRAGHISDIFGMFKRADGPWLSIEEIGRIAAEGWAGTREPGGAEGGRVEIFAISVDKPLPLPPPTRGGGAEPCSLSR